MWSRYPDYLIKEHLPGPYADPDGVMRSRRFSAGSRVLTQFPDGGHLARSRFIDPLALSHICNIFAVYYIAVYEKTEWKNICSNIPYLLVGLKRLDMIVNPRRLIGQKQTYLNILYLLAAFPLGLIYFTFLITGIAVGIGTVIIWIGVPILVVTMLCWWYLAAFERVHTMSWLHVHIPPMSLPMKTKKTFWLRIRDQLGNSMTWKALAYILLKFPFGILSFILVINIPLLVLLFSTITFTIGMIIAPFLYLLTLFTRRALNTKGVLLGFLLFLLFTANVSVFVTCMYVIVIVTDFSFRAIILFVIILFTLLISFMFKAVITVSKKSDEKHLLKQNASINQTTSIKQILHLSLTGCGLTLTPLYLLNGLAWSWGQLARTMLGMSSNAIRASEAEIRAEQERAKAERADQSPRELIVNVSHELRTPIASIRGHVESLMIACDENDTKAPLPQDLHKYLAIVHREAMHLGTLVDDLLSLARTEASELRLDITSIDIAEVIEEVYENLMPLARRERHIALIRDVTPQLSPIMADRQRLIQVLLNLVRNAITYTPDGGIVSIALAQADLNQLVLSVADTGIGIPAEDLEHIFDRFYRTDISRARSSGGFGLGLAIVHDFVIAMGGSVSVKSKIDEGSCFSLHFQTV